MFWRAGGKTKTGSCVVGVLSVFDALGGIVFVSRRVMSDWLFKGGKGEGDDVLLTDTHAQVKETSQMSHIAIERK